MLKRLTSLIFGVFCLWPVIYMGLFFLFAGALVLGSVPDSLNRRATALLYPAHALMIVIVLLTTVVCVFHAIRNKEIAADRRVLWLAILILGGIVGNAAYWYLYLRQPLTAPSSTRTTHA
ncbi:MAG: hypothetical protein U0232_08245 [Thermomicrobiales bacterium]